MIRKVMIGACAVAVLAFTGCQDQRKDAQQKLQKEQQQLSQTQEKAQEQEAQAQADAQNKVLEQKKDVNEAQANAQKQQAEQSAKSQQAQQSQQGEAIGGSGAAAAGAQTATGDLSKVSGNQLTLSPTSGQPVQLQVDQNTRILKDGQPVALTGLHEGDQVRASYEARGNSKYATEVTVTKEGSGAMDKTKQTGQDAMQNTQEGAQDLGQGVNDRMQ